MYYKWSKEFLEAGKARLTGDTKREATSSEVDGLRHENEQLKQVVAELLLKNRVVKKSALGRENDAWEDQPAPQPARSTRSSAWWKARRCR